MSTRLGLAASQLKAAGRSFADWLSEEVSGDLQPLPTDRHFLDTFTTTGELYLIPASRRAEWQAFDTAAEESAEVPAMPDWATPVGELSHVEFENAKEIFK